jgi:hypothetical protein
MTSALLSAALLVLLAVGAARAQMSALAVEVAQNTQTSPVGGSRPARGESPIMAWDGVSPLPARTEMIGSGDGPSTGVSSMGQLCGLPLLSLVVDAEVEQVFPAVKPNIPRQAILATDVILKISHVFKGPDIKRIVVATPGGVIGEFKQIPTERPMLEQGKRYILFLNLGTRGNDAIKDHGLPRYAVIGDAGIFPVASHGRVHFLDEKHNLAFRNQYENASAEALSADVKRACSAPGGGRAATDQK